MGPKSQAQCELPENGSVKNLNFTSKPSLYTVNSSLGSDSNKPSFTSNHEEEDLVNEGRDSKVFGGTVGGILYKWVNYGKGWRSRWFMLEDGVISYYKIHGPDKIWMSPGRDRSVRVIGEELCKMILNIKCFKY